MHSLSGRTHSLFTSTVSGDVDGETQLVGQSLTTLATTKSLGFIVGSLWLGHPLRSKKTENAINLALRLLVDNGPYVSGAVNTIITTRAGKDLISSLVSGLLTIGPRFGGAVNGAAKIWFESVQGGLSAISVVEDFAKRKEYIFGIGHRKYRLDLPEPRVPHLIKLVDQIPHPHLDFALAVEQLTLAKKPNLILNVDGCLAAVMLDLLVHEEHLTKDDLRALIAGEFFNALFVLSRSVGFIAHHLDQVRLDEGLFRLPEDQVLTATR